MVRLASEPTPGRALSIRWTGSKGNAQEIVDWARGEGGNTRFQPPISVDQPARVLVEREHPHSAEWVACPVGATIHRESTADDARLSVELPPVTPAAVPATVDPLRIFDTH